MKKNLPKDKILLMGNPNVGKSIFFTELTGVHAVSSNYAGTTVNFMEGRFTIGEKEYTLIDVPGTYSLTPASEAETVAAQFMQNGAKAVICVLDASNLERNLCLALELQKYKIPMVYTLNLTDVAERHGIFINKELLAQELKAPVVSTVAVKNRGIDELIKKLEAVLNFAEENCGEVHCGKCEIWASAKEIANRVTKKNSSAPNFLDKLGDAMMKPFPGIPIAFLVIALTVCVVVGGGEILHELVLLPLVNNYIVPFFKNIFGAVLSEGILLNVLVGEFGIFVLSFEWIFALIFPYVLLFYVAFTFLEDTGYLPRMSVLFDNVMRKLGVQGGSLIHIIMGFGCAVPAIIGSRAATSHKERIVISAAVCFAVPCISQTGAIISLLSAYAWWMMPAMIFFTIFIFVLVTLTAGKFVKGNVDPLLIEVPNLLMPNPKAYGRKLITRMKHFLHEAEIPMMIAILIAALLSETGLLALIAVAAQPIVSVWLGLPDEAVIALILGVVRREMSVAPLLALDLTALQAFVGGVVSLLYIPCLSVFAILVREFKIKIAVGITLGTITLALLVGGIINQIGQFFF
jgi:ferrous iron transport protein B